MNNDIPNSTRRLLDRCWASVFAASSPVLSFQAGNSVRLVQELEHTWGVGLVARFGVYIQELQEDARKMMPIPRLGRTGVSPQLPSLGWHVADQSSWFLGALCGLERRIQEERPDDVWPDHDTALHLKAALLTALIESTTTDLSPDQATMQERIKNALQSKVRSRFNGYASNWRGGVMENLIASALGWHAELFMNQGAALWDMFCVRHSQKAHGKVIAIQVKWYSNEGVPFSVSTIRAMAEGPRGFLFLADTTQARNGQPVEKPRRITIFVHDVQKLCDIVKEEPEDSKKYVFNEAESTLFGMLYLTIDPVHGVAINFKPTEEDKKFSGIDCLWK